MNLKEIKNVLENNNADFSGVLSLRKRKIKRFVIPISLFFVSISSYVASIICKVPQTIESGDYFNFLFFVWIGITLFWFKQAYLIVTMLKTTWFDKNLEEEHPELYKVYDNCLSVYYQNLIQEDYAFPYFLNDINNISDEIIEECLISKSLESKIKEKTDNQSFNLQL